MGCIISCIPYKSIDFQILRPAQIKLDSNYEKVNIHCEYCKDSTPIKTMDSARQAQARVSLNFIYTLNDNLRKSPVFKNSQFSLVSSDSLLPALKDYKTRSSEKALLIVLDSIYLKDTIVIQKIRYTNNSLYTFGIVHKFGCRTYDQRNMTMLDNYLLQDTAFWPTQDSEWNLMWNIPDINEAIWDTGIKAGEAYAHYLAPYWVEQSRNFFLGGNKTFKEAFNLIQRNQLDSAMNILLKEDKVKSSRNRITKSLYNRAVIFELKDDLVNALVMADSSFRTAKKEASNEYAEKLRLRKLDKLALDWQLN